MDGLFDNRLVITIVGVVAALGISAIVFVGANRLFDLAPRKWSIFSALIGGGSALAFFGLLWGNRLINQPVTTTIVATIIGAAAGYALSLTSDPRLHLGIGALAGAVLGGLIGATLKTSTRPEFDPVALVVGVVVGLAIGFGIWAVRGRTASVTRVALFWGALGWVFGAFLVPDLGGGDQAWAVIAATIGGALFGAWVGTFPNPDANARREIALGSRKYIFLTPALAFIAMTLIIPLIRTGFLSLQSGPPVDLSFTGLTNYADIFTDPTILNLENWTNMFTSQLFWAGVVVLIIGIVVARISGQRTGEGFGINGGSLSALAFGVILLGFAFFAVMRGTISNNLWWIFAVTLFSTGAGLAVAVLADRSRGETIAKSFIFMPMAISFVGAGIIWRFMYIARPETKEQTGVLNSIWVQIGKWSASNTASIIIALILAVIVAGILYIGWTGRQARRSSVVAGAIVAALPLIWLIYRFLGPGIGGVEIVDGVAVASPIFFLTESPFNNFWMMVVFIWIQTGFAMVIFSAAIKGVPADLTEAAGIDGASESQVFWRITVPSIAPTIGVVTTTLIVTVLKVFDIPKVMTNGNFDTQVLANEMWQRAFTELDFGLGSALAFILFLGVLPVMWINIRRMQRQREAVR
ncbi:MAG: sugar ABC transporter permease [Acidimicrobiia bacterium]|nr:sugar ABC transporter permease [Acidimicrobiia bacterium]